MFTKINAKMSTKMIMIPELKQLNINRVTSVLLSPSAGSCRWTICGGSLCAWSSTRSSSPPAGSRGPNTTTSPTMAAPAARRRTSPSSGTTRWDEPAIDDAVGFIFRSLLLLTRRRCKFYGIPSCWFLCSHTFFFSFLILWSVYYLNTLTN